MGAAALLELGSNDLNLALRDFAAPGANGIGDPQAFAKVKHKIAEALLFDAHAHVLLSSKHLTLRQKTSAVLHAINEALAAKADAVRAVPRADLLKPGAVTPDWLKQACAGAVTPSGDGTMLHISFTCRKPTARYALVLPKGVNVTDVVPTAGKGKTGKDKAHVVVPVTLPDAVGAGKKIELDLRTNRPIPKGTLIEIITSPHPTGTAFDYSQIGVSAPTSSCPPKYRVGPAACPLHRYAFSGLHESATYLPGNEVTHDISGTSCGATPIGVWSITITNFPVVPTPRDLAKANPSLLVVDTAATDGVTTGEVGTSLQIDAASLRAILSVKPSGSVSNVIGDGTSVSITDTPVASCP